ncbi:hypothetical protein GCM10017687_69480 [Streptomyces echinatus]
MNVPSGAFGEQHLRALGGRAASLRTDVEDVALDVELDRLGVDTGEVEVDQKIVPGAVGVHRHRRRSGVGAEDLLRESVEVAERVGTHEHHGSLLSSAIGCDALQLFI